MKRTISALAALALAAGLAACTNPNDDLAQQYESGNNQGFISGDGTFQEIPEDERGEPVSFVGTGVDGEDISSEDYAGDVLVINFWYAQCSPCRTEAPILEEVATKLDGEGVHFLGANIYDGPDQARSFEEEFGISYPSLLLKGDADLKLAFAAWTSVQAAPTTLVLDREGRVAARFLGAVRDESILRTLASDLAAVEP